MTEDQDSPFHRYLLANGIPREIYTRLNLTNFHCPHRYFFLTCPVDRKEQVLVEIEKELRNSSTSIESLVEKVSALPFMYKVDGSFNLLHLGPYQRGEMLGMDVTSAIAVHALSLAHNDHVLDLCCAPGAKLILIRAIQQSLCASKGLDSLRNGSVTGVDISRQRLFNCRALIRKCHQAQNIRLFCADGTRFSVPAPREIFRRLFGDDNSVVADCKSPLSLPRPLFACKLLSQDRPGVELIDPADNKTLYDKVLVDAECTHDGSLIHVAKHLNRIQEGDLNTAMNWSDPDALESLQRKLIETGFQSLRPGGLLVYSTCSFASRQNESIIYWFMERYGDQAELEWLPAEIAERLLVHSSRNAELIDRALNENFYGQNEVNLNNLLEEIRRKTFRFYGDMVHDTASTDNEQFWASGFFVARIRKLY